MTTNDVFRVIVDPTRRAILDLLKDEPFSVMDICTHFSMTQGAISQHLKILRDADLVHVTRQGRRRLYAANPLPLLEVFHWLSHYQRFWPKSMDRLEKYLDENADET